MTSDHQGKASELFGRLLLAVDEIGPAEITGSHNEERLGQYVKRIGCDALCPVRDIKWLNDLLNERKLIRDKGKKRYLVAKDKKRLESILLDVEKSPEEAEKAKQEAIEAGTETKLRVYHAMQHRLVVCINEELQRKNEELQRKNEELEQQQAVMKAQFQQEKTELQQRFLQLQQHSCTEDEPFDELGSDSFDEFGNDESLICQLCQMQILIKPQPKRTAAQTATDEIDPAGEHHWKKQKAEDDAPQSRTGEYSMVDEYLADDPTLWASPDCDHLIHCPDRAL